MEIFRYWMGGLRLGNPGGRGTHTPPGTSQLPPQAAHVTGRPGFHCDSHHKMFDYAASLVGHSRRQLFANAAIAVASRVASGTRSTPRLGILRCIRQALATEAVAECICCCGVGKAESNIDLLAFVPAPAAADRDASLTVERVLGKCCESLPAEVRVRPDAGSPVRS
jgi:hypothetical protein